MNNIGVDHGNWGESVAVSYLRKIKYEILERNARPVSSDKRLELDIVAVDKVSRTLVFVEVKQHKSRGIVSISRLKSVDRRKRKNIKAAANYWRLINKRLGGCRFDVIQIFGTPEVGIEDIIHTKDVRLFGEKDRHVNWS